MKLRALIVPIVLGLGCSENADTSVAPSDAATIPDRSVPDTWEHWGEGGIVDPPPPSSCSAPLPSGFACSPVAPKPGAMVCTDEAIAELMTGCFGDTASSTKCSAAQTKWADCARCALKTWTYGDAGYFDTGACMHAIDPDSGCGEAWRCNTDCVAAACSDCDPTEGTGAAGGTTSEFDDCAARAAGAGSATAPKGACYDPVSYTHLDVYKRQLKTWTYGDAGYFDTGACMHAIDPDSGCGEAWRCNTDCVAAACSDCDPTEGTGAAGGTTSEFDDCAARAAGAGSATAPKGACYDLAAKDLQLCRLNTKVAVCFVDSVADVARFITGACRDGGDWSKVTAIDAGAD